MTVDLVHRRLGKAGAFDAAGFDLDGVVTFTVRVHAAAWNATA